MADRLAVGRTGSGAYAGRSYSVLPLVVSAPTPELAYERVNELLDRLEVVVGQFGGAEVVSSLAECLECAEYAVQMYGAQVRAVVAEKARNQ